MISLQGIENKYKELLYIDNARYDSAEVIDEDTCIIKFRVQTQEINCKISRKDGKVVEGNVDLVENVQYIMGITRNPSPIVEEVGHAYLIVDLQRIGVTRQIV